MIGLLVGICVGLLLGIYLERSFDVSFWIRSGWDDARAVARRFNQWRKGWH